MITITIICLSIAQQHDNGWNFFYLKIARQSQNIAQTVFNQPIKWLGGFATVHLFKSQHCVLFCIVKIKFTFQHWILEKPVQPPVVFILVYQNIEFYMNSVKKQKYHAKCPLSNLASTAGSGQCQGQLVTFFFFLKLAIIFKCLAKM